MKIIVWFSVLMMVFFGYSCTSGKGDGIRYIFFLIGDGMGNGQVTGTQFYRAELDGRIGLDSLSETEKIVCAIMLLRIACGRVKPVSW